MTEADKQMARYNLILEQTGQQQGQAAREANSFNGKLMRLVARFKDLGARIGTRLLGPMGKLLDMLESLMGWVESLSPTMQKWALGIAMVAAAIGPLLLALGFMLPAIGAVITAIAFLISPIGLVVIAIAALVAGLVYAYTEFEGFRNVVNTAASSIVAGFGLIIDGIMALKAAFDQGGWAAVWDTFRAGVVNAFNQVMQVIEAFVSYISARFPVLGLIIGAVATAVGWVVDAIRTLVGMAINFATHEQTIAAFKLAWTLLEGAIRWVWSAIKTVVDTAISFATHERTIDTFKKAWGLLEGAIRWVWSAITTIVDGVISFATHETTISTFQLVWEKLTDAIGLVGDAIDLVQSINLDLSKITQPIEDLIKLFKDGVQAAKDFWNWVNGGGGEDSGGWGGVGELMGTALKIPALAGASAAIERIADQMQAVTLATQAATAAGDAFGVAGFRAFKPWNTGLMDMPPQVVATTAAMHLMERAGLALGNGMESVGAQVSGSALLMATSVKNNLGGVSGIVNTEFSGIRSSSLTNFSAAHDAARTNTSLMRTVSIANAEAMKSSVSNSAETMKSNVSLAMAGTNTAVALQTALMMAAAKAQGLLMVSNAQAASDAMKAAWTSGAAGSAAAVSAQLGRIPGIVASVGGQAVGIAYSIGANISGAFASGMLSQLGTIQSAANAMVVAASTALIAKAMISSPSKLFMGYGAYVGEGFEQGIRSTIPDAARAAADLVGVPHLTPLDGYGIGAQIHNHNYYSVTPEELRKLIQDAEDGGTFARRFGAELAMYGGKV